jgi:SAM-dependent methyltransferase
MEVVTCELCRSDHARIFLRQRDLTHGVTDEEFTVVRCEMCGFLYMNPRPTQAEIGKFYPTQYYAPPSPPRRFSRVKRWIMEDFYGYPAASARSPWRRLRKLLLWPEMVRRAVTGRTILPWVGKGRLLDVGCGHGVNDAILLQQGWEVHALDVSTAAVEHARSLLGDRVQAGDLMTVRYGDESFDVVVFSHSLEHIYGLRGVLAEVRRVLDSSGVFVVAVPNAGSWEAKIFSRWWFPWELPRHLHHFERKTLRRLLEQAGFQIVSIRTGVTAVHFVTSLERFWLHLLGRALPARRLIERFFARPFCLLAGNLGYGTEIIVHAVKARAESEGKGIVEKKGLEQSKATSVMSRGSA